MAQQVCYWDGSTDTDYATATNWTGTVERVPLSADGGDIAVFDSRQSTKPTTGMADDGASNSGHTDNAELSLVHFKEGYTGGIGTLLLPFTTSAAKIIIDGTGDYHILCGETNQSTDTIVEMVIVNNTAANVYLYSNCNDGANLAEFTAVYVAAGTLYAGFYDSDTDNTGCYIKDLYLTPRENKANNATVIIEKDAYDELSDVATNIYMNNGTLTTDSQVGTFVMRNGKVYYGSEANTALGGTVVTEADMNITELRQHGGTFNWYPDDTGDPYIGILLLFGGTFDASGSTSDDIDKVLGNGAGKDIYIYPDSILNLANSKGNITVAASSQLWNLGGVLTVDSYTQLALTYDAP